MSVIHFALLLEIIALWLERMVPATRAYLPLGGDHFVQLAALVILAVIITHAWEMMKALRKPPVQRLPAPRHMISQPTLPNGHEDQAS